MADDEDGPLQKLVASFGSMLDEALIVAIAHDHDLTSAAGYQSARATLDGLAEHVTCEEATGFNPSGVPQDSRDLETQADEAESTVTTTTSRPASRSHVTESSGTDLSSSSHGAQAPMLSFTTFDDDSDEAKAAQLQACFPDLKEYDVKYALKKANSDFQAALDELLNVQYLESSGMQVRGIDGFFHTENGRSKRRGKKRGKKAALTDGSTTPEVDESIKHQEDIAYLADRFDAPVAKISEVYYKKHCSSGATAVEILDEYIELGIEAQDDASKQQAKELAAKYRQMPVKYMTTIVQVTVSIPQFAEDLAALLNKHFSKNQWTQKLDLSYRLTPLPQEDIEGGSSGVHPGGTAAGGKRPAIGLRPASFSGLTDYTSAAQVANNYHNNRRAAATSAAHMARRGASNSLYRQAASYYSDRAREQGRYAQHATSEAAELLVDEHSTTTSIDLHGVQVLDGTRIARQRVQAWWDGLGESRLRRAREQPFTVITGLGRHSAGGVSQMRQAVARALLHDGWRVQVETGRFVINGRR